MSAAMDSSQVRSARFIIMVRLALVTSVTCTPLFSAAGGTLSANH